MNGQRANATVNQARAILVAALGLAGASRWEVTVTAQAVTPDPGEPASSEARQLLQAAFAIPEGRDYVVLVRPHTATYTP